MTTPSSPRFPLHVVSGGQTGIDRAALDVAIELGWTHGGWCPLGRLAEDGFIPVRYRLRQTDSPNYSVRTERNVLDSDATLILYAGELTGGTELTWRLARSHRRPCWLLDMTQPINADRVYQWLHEHGINTLNVAGPRESTSPGITEAARNILRPLFQHWEQEPRCKQPAQQAFAWPQGDS